MSRISPTACVPKPPTSGGQAGGRSGFYRRCGFRPVEACGSRNNHTIPDPLFPGRELAPSALANPRGTTTYQECYRLNSSVLALTNNPDPASPLDFFISEIIKH